MEQIKERISMIRPIEWEDTHLEAHEKINASITQFYELFDNLIAEINSIEKKSADAEEKNFASFSKLDETIMWISNGIKLLVNKVQELEKKINERKKFLTKRYQWIVDTEREATVDLETITDDELKWKQYLVNVVINEALPNQWAIDYSFPKTTLAQWEYTPRIYLEAKEWEHAVLEYDFTVILTEV